MAVVESLRERPGVCLDACEVPMDRGIVGLDALMAGGFSGVGASSW